MKILVVEDEVHIAEGLRFNIEAEGHAPLVVHSGEEALRELADDKYDAVVLDVMLPGIDGFEVARTMRGRADYTPVLMLTARGRPEDVLTGFEAGADDYLPKPFDLEIFLARLGGLLRRNEWAAQREPAASSKLPATFTVNEKVINFDNLELLNGGEIVQLTLMEMKLLRYLIEHEGQIVSRKTILEDVWGLQEDTDTRAIDNFIVRLRRYIEKEPGKPKHLLTVRGVGYRFTASPDK
jgi:DNA-binding response OmpR family regulator